MAFCRLLRLTCHESLFGTLWRRLFTWLVSGPPAKLYRALAETYRTSRFGSLLHRFFTWLGAQWDGSRSHWRIYRRGLFERSWERSLFCQVLTWILSLPLRLFQWLYQSLKGILDGSVCVRFVLGIGEHACVAVFALFSVLLSLHQEHYRNTYLLAVAGIILFLVYLGRIRKPAERISMRAVQPWVVLFFLCAVISILAAVDFSLSVRYLTYYIPCAMLVLAMVHAADTPKHLEWSASGLLVGVCATALYGFYQFFVIGVDPSSSYTDLALNAGMPGRVYSLYDNPNALGAFFLLTLPVIAALVLASPRKGRRAVAAVAGVLGFICLLMTYSRSSWVALMVAGVLYLLLWKRSALPYSMLVAVALLPLLPDVILNRLATIVNPNDTSASSRTALFSAGWRVFQDAPLTGVGLGEDAVRAVVNNNYYFREKMQFIHAHNMLLQIGAEMGILGVIPYVGAIFGTLRETMQAVRETDCKLAKHVAIGGSSALVGSFVYGFADYLWTYPRVMFLFWFVFGLTLAAIRICRDNART